MAIVPYLRHDLLNDDVVCHGFFTRLGGVSSGAYDSLNCGLGSNDNPTYVKQNRHLAAEALGGKFDQIAGLYQVHSNICHIADPLFGDRPTGDALVTDQTHTTLAILTADCVPVLFCDERNGIIGAAHAGWRGAVKGIVKSTLETMISLGAKTKDTKAVIGPAIQQQSYQVGIDVRDEVLDNHAEAADRFVADGPDKWKFDLPGFVSDQLTSFDIDHHTMTEDTYSDERFFSHRRNTHQNGSDTGRLVSMIRLKT